MCPKFSQIWIYWQELPKPHVTGPARQGGVSHAGKAEIDMLALETEHDTNKTCGWQGGKNEGKPKTCNTCLCGYVFVSFKGEPLVSQPGGPNAEICARILLTKKAPERFLPGANSSAVTQNLGSGGNHGSSFSSSFSQGNALPVPKKHKTPGVSQNMPPLKWLLSFILDLKGYGVNDLRGLAHMVPSKCVARIPSQWAVSESEAPQVLPEPRPHRPQRGPKVPRRQDPHAAEGVGGAGAGAGEPPLL